jgi:hypothetical protein
MRSEQGNNRPDPIPKAVCATSGCTNRLIFDQEENIGLGLCQECSVIRRINDPIKVFNHPVLVSLVVKTSTKEISTTDVLDELHLKILQDTSEPFIWSSGEPSKTILVNPQI